MFKFVAVFAACFAYVAAGVVPTVFTAAPAAVGYANAPLYAAGGSQQIDVRHNYDGTLSSYTTTPFAYTSPVSSRYVAGAPALSAAYAAAPAAFAAPTAYASAPAAFAAPVAYAGASGVFGAPTGFTAAYGVPATYATAPAKLISPAGIVAPFATGNPYAVASPFGSGFAAPFAPVHV